MFWKKELSDRALAVTELEHKLRVASEAAARDADAAAEARAQAERLRGEAAAAAAGAAAVEAALRREVGELQASLERAQQHGSGYGYGGDHDSPAERELATARSEFMRLQAEARRLQVRGWDSVFC